MENKKKLAVFTMDLEHFVDTGCVRESGVTVQEDMLDGLDEYIELLEKHGIKATLFAMCPAAEKIQKKIKKYLKAGHTLALHGDEHIAPMTMSGEQFEKSVAGAKATLEEMFDTRIRGYRAPFFSLDNQRLEMLEKLGFDYDSSRFTFQKRSFAGQINVDGFERLSEGAYKRGGLYEFGVSCQHFMGIPVPLSGGGYVRLGNWGFVLTMLADYLQKSDYYVFYLHPFELSKRKVPHIPKLKLYDQWYLSVGLHTYRYKIETIIKLLKKKGYEFVTFEQMADYYNKTAF